MVRKEKSHRRSGKYSAQERETKVDGSSLFLLYSRVFDALKSMGVVEGPAFGEVHPPEPVLICLSYWLDSSPSFSF